MSNISELVIVDIVELIAILRPTICACHKYKSVLSLSKIILVLSGPIEAGVQRVHRTRAAKTRGGRRAHIVLSIKQNFLK